MSEAPEYFLNSYKECRQAFRSSAKRAAARFKHSSRRAIDAGGKGKIDTILLRARRKDSKRLILISSGVHGVEGFVGSAIQRRLLDDFTADLFPLRSDVLFVHGINPFGFRKKRRVNQNNVDLNRNFYLKREKIPKKEKNKGYRRLASFFMPGLPFTFWPLEFAVFAVRFLGIMIRFGARKFTDAAVNGQFEFKRGIYYGGRKPEPVVRRLREFFAQTVSGYEEILFLDVHTGYGEENGILLIQNADRGSYEDQNIERISAGLPLTRPDSGETFYKTAGDFTDFLRRIFPERKNIFPLTVELGTVGNLQLYGALRSSFLVVAENRIHHRGAWFPSTRKKVREKFLRLFYPAAEKWRQHALSSSIILCRELFERFENLPSGQVHLPEPVRAP
ncbi:MAG: DUF2817 domain-containing protein [Leptospirales bacterium]|nr:DUF2817 domain-containing protein [Leptospirales bacterium]